MGMTVHSSNCRCSRRERECMFGHSLRELLLLAADDCRWVLCLTLCMFYYYVFVHSQTHKRTHTHTHTHTCWLRPTFVAEFCAWNIVCDMCYDHIVMRNGWARDAHLEREGGREGGRKGEAQVGAIPSVVQSYLSLSLSLARSLALSLSLYNIYISLSVQYVCMLHLWYKYVCMYVYICIYVASSWHITERTTRYAQYRALPRSASRMGRREESPAPRSSRSGMMTGENERERERKRERERGGCVQLWTFYFCFLFFSPSLLWLTLYGFFSLPPPPPSLPLSLSLSAGTASARTVRTPIK